jgi:regulator of RNase E activity RraB
MDISEIAASAEVVDAETFHLSLVKLIESGECDGYFDAITTYCETNNVHPEDTKKLFTPTLKALLERECVERRLLKSNGSTAKLPD